MSDIDQGRLDTALIEFHNYSKDGADKAHMITSADHEAAAVLAKQGLINCVVTELVSGRYRLRFTATDLLTPLGKQRLAEILN